MKNYFEFMQQLNEVAKGGTVPWAGKTRGPYDKAKGGRDMLAGIEADARLYAQRMKEMQPIFAAIDDYKAGKPIEPTMMKQIEPYIKQLGIQRGTPIAGLAAKPVVASRPPFNWDRSGAGWWHPTKQWFRFTHDGANYHVTQVYKTPEKFGITHNEVRAVIKEYLQKNRDYAYTDKINSKRMTLEQAVIGLGEEIRNGYRDIFRPLQKYVYNRGWLKIYGGHDCYMEGTMQSSYKAAMREIIKAYGNKTEYNVEIANYGPHDEYPDSKNYNRQSSREQFAS